MNLFLIACIFLLSLSAGFMSGNMIYTKEKYKDCVEHNDTLTNHAYALLESIRRLKFTNINLEEIVYKYRQIEFDKCAEIVKAGGDRTEVVNKYKQCMNEVE